MTGATILPMVIERHKDLAVPPQDPPKDPDRFTRLQQEYINRNWSELWEALNKVRREPQTTPESQRTDHSF